MEIVGTAEDEAGDTTLQHAMEVTTPEEIMEETAALLLRWIIIIRKLTVLVIKPKSTTRSFGLVGAALVAQNADLPADTWFVDSGATDHLCSDLFMFSDVILLSEPTKIYLGDNRFITATAQGTVHLPPMFSPC